MNELVLKELQRLHNGIVIEREKIVGQGVLDILDREWIRRCGDKNDGQFYLRAALTIATLDQKGVGEWCMQQVV